MQGFVNLILNGLLFASLRGGDWDTVAFGFHRPHQRLPCIQLYFPRQNIVFEIFPIRCFHFSFDGELRREMPYTLFWVKLVVGLVKFIISASVLLFVRDNVQHLLHFPRGLLSKMILQTTFFIKNFHILFASLLLLIRQFPSMVEIVIRIVQQIARILVKFAICSSELRHIHEIIHFHFLIILHLIATVFLILMQNLLWIISFWEICLGNVH